MKGHGGGDTDCSAVRRKSQPNERSATATVRSRREAPSHEAANSRPRIGTLYELAEACSRPPGRKAPTQPSRRRKEGLDDTGQPKIRGG